MILASFAAMSCALPAYGDNEAFPKPATDLPLGKEGETRTAILAGGCFWCTEAVFKQLNGVSKVLPGYSGGTKETANYEAVCSGQTAHAEAIAVTYDAAKVSYGQLLRIFFAAAHDPTTKNRQGADVGPQYRSAIFYASDDEKRVAEAYIKQLNDAKQFSSPIVTTLEPLEAFYPAEQYHHDYAELNPNQPYIRGAAAPKVAKVRKAFADEVKQPATQPGK